jgi:hypothetical protein
MLDLFFFNFIFILYRPLIYELQRKNSKGQEAASITRRTKIKQRGRNQDHDRPGARGQNHRLKHANQKRLERNRNQIGS